MPDTDFLKYLINEDIYKLDDESGSKNTSTDELSDIIDEGKTQPQCRIFKTIVVIVDGKDTELINQADREYLEKILTAVKIDLDKISIVNSSKEPIKNLSGIEKIIDFTIDHRLNPVAKPYQLTDFNGVKMIVANPLSEIESSVEFRKKLWGVLQEMFQ